MTSRESMVDIHCHLLPGLDDGSPDWETTLAMAEMAAADGIRQIAVTPHQLGGSAVAGDTIRSLTAEAQSRLDARGIPLRLVTGADVRIEPEMVAGIRRGHVMTLADRRRHVLLELPHELYIPLDRLLGQLQSAGIVGILTHPERNRGILRQPEVLPPLVHQGCLLQVTAGSLTGSFGPDIQRFTERLIQQQLVHFVSTDAHGIDSRRPILSRAMQRVAEIAGEREALELCCRNPARVVAGESVPVAPPSVPRTARRGWFGRRRAA